MTKQIMRITRCEDCKYEAITSYDKLECGKCKGKLEILASTDKKEVIL